VCSEELKRSKVNYVYLLRAEKLSSGTESWTPAFMPRLVNSLVGVYKLEHDQT
jgi:hypothetical protein